MSTTGFETFSGSFSTFYQKNKFKKKTFFQKRIKSLGSKTHKSYLICFSGRYFSLAAPMRH